jgi:hypothetical protein
MICRCHFGAPSRHGAAGPRKDVKPAFGEGKRNFPPPERLSAPRAGDMLIQRLEGFRCRLSVQPIFVFNGW